MEKYLHTGKDFEVKKDFVTLAGGRGFSKKQMEEVEMKKLAISIVLIFILNNVSFAEIGIWNLVTMRNQPYSNVFFDKLENDTLYVKSFDKTHAIHIDSIQYISKPGKRGGGSFAGGLLGGIAGFLTTTFVKKGSTGSKDISTAMLGR
jgi:hypothetical protein